jgi:RNase adapter protein RapZ
MRDTQIVIVTGLSGSGKSVAIKCFEDLGFFCVDNLPPALLPKFTDLCVQRGGEVNNVALGIDIRERGFFEDFFGNLERLKLQGYQIELLFFEARDEVVVRRFSETRRPHPLLPQSSLLEGVQLERERLQELRERADRIIDTSDITVHELKDLLARHYVKEDQERLTITLVTFGYKFGVPYDADLVFDVRFLRNPNFLPELKPLTGEDPRVQAYMQEDPHASALLGHFESLFKFLLPLFLRERRSYLTIAIGCTGGRHRSVAIAYRLREIFAGLGHSVTIRHRDIHHP